MKLSTSTDLKTNLNTHKLKNASNSARMMMKVKNDLKAQVLR